MTIAFALATLFAVPHAAVAGEPLDPGGLSPVRAQRFDNGATEKFPAEAGEAFGSALAAGDFDGDGVADLATGLFLDNGAAGNGCERCGAVIVRRGVAGRGLASGPPTAFLSQQVFGSPDPANPDEQFGYALATGDFNDDQRDDLAIGVPFDLHDGVRGGAVQIHYGTPGGLPPGGEHVLRAGVGGVPGSRTGFEFFGYSLAVGDFNDDGFDDLAVGAPLARLTPSGPAVGTVTVFHGGEQGLLPFVGYLVHQDAPSVPDVAEANDLFGFAVTTGNFDGDDYDDLAIGVPQEDTVGAFLVLFGSDVGVLFANGVWCGQSVLQAGEVSEAGDLFGATLAAANFNGDGCDDLLIGAPDEDLCDDCAQGEVLDAGTVAMVYGSPVGGIDLGSSWFLDEGDEISDSARFGISLVAADFSRFGRDDVAIGHTGEDSDSGLFAGAVTVVGASDDGPFGLRRTFVVGLEGVPGEGVDDGRGFGAALAAGDFDDDGHPDLAVGTPQEDLGEIEDAGMEVVLFGSLFADGFESGDVDYWIVSIPPGPVR